tara:strand:- start:454 stop:3165 length:2712 start_codon:yes stop_codon:yes gene_type:complete
MADKKTQKDYNDELRQTRSLLGEIQSKMDDLVKKSDGRNKKLAQFVSINKKILGDYSQQERYEKNILKYTSARESAEKKIIALQAKKDSVLKSSVGKSSDIQKQAQQEAKGIQSQIDLQSNKAKELDGLLQKEKENQAGQLTSTNLQSKLNELALQRQSIMSTNFGVNEKNKSSLLAQVQAQEAMIQKSINAQSVMDGVGNSVDNVTKSIGDGLDNVQDTIEKIPLLGPVLGGMFEPFKNQIKEKTKFLGEQFKSKFNESFQAGLKGNKTFAQAFKGGIADASKHVGSLGKAFLGTTAGIVAAAVLIGAVLVKAFQMGFERFKEIAQAARDFRNETGLLNSQTTQLEGNISRVSANMANLGVSAGDVSKAASEFVNEFQGIEQPSEAVLGSMVMLNKNFGVGVAEGAKLNKVFQNLGDLSAEQSQALIGQTASMAKMAGVAPQKVIKDMADSSEYAYKYFQGSPKELAKAAVQAAKMGTSIAEAGKAADNLMDFQSSITKELEASAILGVNLNLSQARYAAANGDLIGQQQAINDQVAQLGDLTKLNVFEQQALADATGMEFSSLVNQQRIRERFGKLSQEQLAAATSLVDAGKDINSLTEKDLQDQTERMARQQEMQSKIEKMQNTFKALGTQIADALAPFASTVIDIATMLGSVLVPTFKVLGAIIKVAFLPITFAFKVLRNIFDTIKAIRDDGFGGLVSKLQEMGPLMSFIVGLVATLGVIWLATILPSVISTVVSLAVGLVGALVMAIPLIVSMAIGFITSAIAAISTMSALTLGIGAIAIIGGIAAASAAANSAVSEGESTVEGSIQDGVIGPDGNIITTDPADFIIATKDPSGLAEDVVGGGSMAVDMSGVISELQSLKQAFLSNKDVYMDKSLVTSAVTNTQERSGRENRFGLQGA